MTTGACPNAGTAARSSAAATAIEFLIGVRGASPVERIASTAGQPVTVRQCLDIVVREEWLHHEYATRDLTILEHTPIDYLDFASPVSGLGSKMGIDATNKWPGESERRWGRPIVMDAAVKRRVDALWQDLGL
mgnify:CR=1 FL=1